MFDYLHLKRLMYFFETAMGVLLIWLSSMLAGAGAGGANPLEWLIPAAILFCVGAVCMLFGLTTFFLRDDVDIWR